MSTDLLLETHDVTEAVRTVLATETPTFAAHAGQLPVKAAVPYHLITARAPRPEGPPMAGDQTLELTLSVTTAGENLEQAERGGAAVRSVIVGRDGLGAFLVDLPLDGRTVLARSCNYDGAPDLVAGIPQWTETYQLMVGRGAG